MKPDQLRLSTESHPAVIAALRDEIKGAGKISFARFMELALYHPKGGYYRSGAAAIGPSGDFETSPGVHPIFGKCVAAQIIQMSESLSGQNPFQILEAGAGRGILARDLLEALREKAPALFDRTRYLILETSGPLRQEQGALLKERPELQARCEWVDEIPAGFQGVIFGNELLDAFPVHRLEGTAEGFAELMVEEKGGSFKEAYGPPSSPRLAAYLDRLRVRLAVGQQAEIGLAAVDWMGAAARALASGFLMLIDYGHTAGDLFATHRRRGSLMAYHRHQATESYFERIGRQDLTAHLDFTSLALAARDEGLTVTGFTNQLSFLMGLGIADEMAEMDPESESFSRMRHLIRPGGMGETFKILILHKGVTPPDLDGLKFRPFREGVLYRGIPGGDVR